MIITSLLDTDLYKLTMMQAVLHQFPGAIVEYRFKCRNKGVDLRPFADQIRKEIQALCELRFQKDELDYLRNFSFLKTDYLDFLRVFQLNAEFVEVIADAPELDIVIKGPWLHTILFEIPILAIVGEIYYRETYPSPDMKLARARLEEKIAIVATQADPRFRFSEFGTRRRFSYAWQEEVVRTLHAKIPSFMNGTSNVLFAKKLGIKPMGTMAHEYMQACQSLGPRLIYSQKFAFEKWVQEYRGELGIALSDTYGLKPFLNDFDLYFCKLFDGARQDSGDPFEWGDALIAHYQKMRIDPKTKTLVFTDQLSIDLALKIHEYFKDRANIAFGIGTHLTCDFNFPALQNVIKMVECNGQPVAKVSDSPEKTMCRDPSYLNYLKYVFKIE